MALTDTQVWKVKTQEKPLADNKRLFLLVNRMAPNCGDSKDTGLRIKRDFYL